MKNKNQCVYCGVKKSLIAEGNYYFCKDCLYSTLLIQQEHIRGLIKTNNNLIKQNRVLSLEVEKLNDFNAEVLVKKLNGGEKN